MKYWIGLSSVLRSRQHSIGYMGDGFLQAKRPNQQYQSTEGTNSTRRSYLWLWSAIITHYKLLQLDQTMNSPALRFFLSTKPCMHTLPQLQLLNRDTANDNSNGHLWAGTISEATSLTVAIQHIQENLMFMYALLPTTNNDHADHSSWLCECHVIDFQTYLSAAAVMTLGTEILAILKKASVLQ